MMCLWATLAENIELSWACALIYIILVWKYKIVYRLQLCPRKIVKFSCHGNHRPRSPHDAGALWQSCVEWRLCEREPALQLSTTIKIQINWSCWNRSWQTKAVEASCEQMNKARSLAPWRGFGPTYTNSSYCMVRATYSFRALAPHRYQYLLVCMKTLRIALPSLRSIV